MKKTILAILAAVITMAAAAPAFAQAQTQAQPRSIPGPIIGKPVVPTGIRGRILLYNGELFAGATVVMRRVDDGEPNNKTIKRFAPCTGGRTENCAGIGQYSVNDLPEPRAGYSPWRWINIRVEAKDFVNFESEAVLVYTDGQRMVSADDIFLHRTLLRTGEAVAVWTSGEDFVVAFPAKNAWYEDLRIEYNFTGPAYQKVEADYSTPDNIQTFGPTLLWMVDSFSIPAYVDASGICVTITIRHPDVVKDVREVLEKTCLGPRPPVLTGGGAKIK